jgi:hypothetical protein
MEPIRFVKASAATGAEEPNTKEQMEATRLLDKIKSTFSSGATMHNILLIKVQEDKTEKDRQQKESKNAQRDKGALQQHIDELWTPSSEVDR